MNLLVRSPAQLFTQEARGAAFARCHGGLYGLLCCMWMLPLLTPALGYGNPLSTCNQSFDIGNMSIEICVPYARELNEHLSMQHKP